MAFGSLAMSAGLSAALVWQSANGSIVPWVVQVDKFGAAQAVAPATADYQPNDPQTAFYLARFIEEVRGIPADPIIVRQNWLRAYDFTTQGGALALILVRVWRNMMQAGVGVHDADIFSLASRNSTRKKCPSSSSCQRK